MRKLSLILIAMLLAAIVILPTHAAEKAVVTIDNATAYAGDTVTVDVTITQATFAAYYVEAINYDTTALKLTEITQGNASMGLYSGNAKEGIVSAVNASNSTVSGMLFRLTFQVLKDTLKTYPITMQIKSFVKADQSVLDIVLVNGSVTVACNHNWGTPKVTEATCTAEGKKVYTCSECGQTKTDTVAKKEHSLGAWKTTVAPSCTKKGSESATCSVCKTTVTRELSKIDHTYLEWTVSREPTCVSNGEETSICTRCGAKGIRETTLGGHLYTEWTTIREASCNAHGEEFSVCDRCGEETSTRATDKLAHSFGEWLTVKEANCHEKGHLIRICSVCSVCEQSYPAVTSHEWEWVVDKAPTAEEEGVQHQACKHCDAVMDENTPIAPSVAESEASEGGGSMSAWWILAIIIPLLVAAGLVGYVMYQRMKKPTA